MKSLIVLFAVAITFLSCKEMDIKKVEYRSTTMMGKTTVTITADSVVTTFNGRGDATRTSRTLSTGEWNALMESLVKVELSKISSLESPTNKRATDAAPYGTIEITTKDSVYTSASFDGKNPHEMLMPTMQEIIKIWEKK